MLLTILLLLVLPVLLVMLVLYATVVVVSHMCSDLDVIEHSSCMTAYICVCPRHKSSGPRQGVKMTEPDDY